MAEAIISGLIRSKTIEPQMISVSDTDRRKLDHLKKRYGVVVLENNGDLARGNDAIILAVKPQQLSYVLAGISSAIGPNHLFISIAAGKKTETIEGQIEGEVAVVRVMPNFNAMVNASVSLICSGRFANDEQIELTRTIFESIGVTEVLDEALFNQATAISGSGPAYFFLFTEALTDSAVRVGLPRELAQRMVIETMIGSGVMLRETGNHPAELKDSVISPGGTTAAALDFFERCGIRGAILQGVEAAVKRGYELD